MSDLGQGGSNEYPQSMFLAEIYIKKQSFLSENVWFLEVKVSIYLNRRIFVMYRATTTIFALLCYTDFKLKKRMLNQRQME